MSLIDDLHSDVQSTINQVWSIRDGQTVPTTESVLLAGGAVRLNATFLYADLADSTDLAMYYDKRVGAKVFKCFLACCSKIIRQRGGFIRSFDGDRVMGIFIGDNKNTSAARCALNINYAFREIIKPSLENKYPALASGSYELAHCVGIDTSEVLAVRSGVRNNNDLVWVGQAPNIAAKLSGIRSSPYHSYISEDVFDMLNDSSKYGPNEEPMWERRINSSIGVSTIYRSSWQWKP